MKQPIQPSESTDELIGDKFKSGSPVVKPPSPNNNWLDRFFGTSKTDGNGNPPKGREQG